MAAIAFQKPAMQLTANAPEINTLSYPVAAAQTFVAGDILQINGSGAVIKSVDNPATLIAGMAERDANATYVNASGVSVGNQSLFGANFAGSLLNSEPSNIQVAQMGDGARIVFSVVQAKNQNLVGTTFAIGLDGGTGLFVADSSKANKILTLVRWLEGPGLGNAADTGARAEFVVSTATALIN